jgi:hypothetical protein
VITTQSGGPSQSENNPAAKYMPDSSSEHSDNPSESSSFTAPARPNLTFFGSKPPCKTCLLPRPDTTSTIVSQLPIGDLRYKPTPPNQTGLPPKEIFSKIQTQNSQPKPSIDHRTPILRYRGSYSETKAQSTIRTPVISNNR